MINKQSIGFIQNILQMNLINLNIDYIDEFKYNLLIGEILHFVSLVIPEIQLSTKTITNKFSDSYIIINSINPISILNGNLTIFLDVKDNLICNVEVSVLS